MHNESLLLLNDIITVLISLIGILITVGTVLSSFILSKRDSLKSHAEEKKRGRHDFVLERTIRAESHFIERTRKRLSECISLLIISSLVLFIDLFVKNVSIGVCSNVYYSFICIILFILSTLVIVFVVVYIIIQFNKIVKELEVKKKSL